MLFSSFRAGESRRFSLNRLSTRPTLKCFGRSSKLVPFCFSLYSFFFPALISLSFVAFPFPFVLLPFSILPSFLPLCSSALSHLSGVSTSISKKSSRELFVGKCREPAVLCTGWNRSTKGERDKGKRCRRKKKVSRQTLLSFFRLLSPPWIFLSIDVHVFFPLLRNMLIKTISLFPQTKICL